VDEPLFRTQIRRMRNHYRLCLLSLIVGWVPICEASTPDLAGQQAAGIVAGLEHGSGGRVLFSEKTGRLEVRDEQGSLIDEMALGTAGKVVDVAGQEYRLSFGKDEMGRRSVLVRAGPGMRKPITVDVLGRKSVLSTEASLLATIDQKNRIYYEPSICGQVYYVEGNRTFGSEVSRRAVLQRESATLAKPSPPTPESAGTLDPVIAYNEEMESAGNKFKSAFLTVLGLPDRQASPKANVYRLGGDSAKATPSGASTPPAQAGRLTPPNQ
jgi:hypothetical protein